MSQEWHPNPDHHHPYCQFRREGDDCTCVEGREGTRMTARDAWAQVAHNLRVLADSIDSAIEPDAARASVPDRVPTAPAVAAAGSPPPAAASRSDAALGYCPTHGVPWSVQPGGISKRTNKRYSAFWKCKEKDGDNYCNEKPLPVWADTHPATEPAPAPAPQDVDDIPF